MRLTFGVLSLLLVVPVVGQRFAPSHSPSQVHAGLTDMLVADFDGDGFLDLLSLQEYASHTDPSLPWLLSRGDGTGVFAEPIAVVSPPGARSIGIVPSVPCSADTCLPMQPATSMGTAI